MPAYKLFSSGTGQTLPVREVAGNGTGLAGKLAPQAARRRVDQGSVATEEFVAAGEAGRQKTQDTPADDRGRGDARLSNYSVDYGAGAGAGAGSAGGGSAGGGAGSAGAGTAAGASTGAGAGAVF